MKKQQLSVFLFLMMSLFFVGNILGQTNGDPKPKDEGSESGSPNNNGDPLLACQSTWYFVSIGQNFDSANPIVPDSIEVVLLTTWSDGSITEEVLINKTGNTLEDYYHDIYYSSGVASFDLERIYLCDIISINHDHTIVSGKKEVVVTSTYGDVKKSYSHVVVGDDEHNISVGSLILNGVFSYPNPSSQPLIQVSYKLINFAKVYIDVYDDSGNKVVSLQEVLNPAGVHTVSFRLPQTGIYTCKVVAHNFQTNQLDIQSARIIRN